MKIVCESCGAKYSIADEKVAGKVFKIRCKRCSEVIMVRGDQPAPESVAESSEAPVEDAAIWHVVVNGEQQGPYIPQQLADMLSAGTIDWEAFVWREGFDNWVALRNVDELVAMVSNVSQGPEDVPTQSTTAAGGFGAVNAADAFAGEPSMGADPFADDSPAPSTLSNHDDLFASGPLTGGGAREGGRDSSIPAGGAASPRVSTESAMTGARNENSVLFSLKNLQALATGSGDTPSRESETESAPGFANGEGSGLIDIRALANANSSAQPKEATEDNKDELLSLTSQGTAFGGLGSPMMAPPPEENNGGNRSVLVASILGGFLLVAAAVVAVGMLNRPVPQTASAVAPTVAPEPSATAAQTPTGAQAAPAANAAQPPEPAAEEPSEGELAARRAAEAEQEEKEEADEEPSGARRAERRARSAARRRNREPARGNDSAEAQDTEAKPAERTADKRDKSSSSASLDDLLAGAVNNRSSKSGSSQPQASAAGANLPEKPSRDEVMDAMNKVRSAVSACGGEQGGVAFANVTVAGKTGRVTNATIEGQTGSVGSCIARAVRKARFPKFKSDTFKVKFPFRL